MFDRGARQAVVPLDPGQALSVWRLNVPVLVVVIALGAGYLVAAARRPSRWPLSRTVSFLVGLGTLLVATVSWIGAYADLLFWVRAAQNLILLMIAPMFLALGAPLTLLRDVLPDRSRQRASRLLHCRPARLATFPLVIAFVLVAPLYVLYLTPLYPAAQRHGWLAGVVGTGLVAAGFVYFWTRLRVDPTPRTDPHLVTVAMSIAEVVLDGALGVRLWLGPMVTAGYYEGVRSWGPDARLDQTIGAGVLWFGGDLAGLVFLACVARRMINDDEAQAELIDAALDEAAKPTAPAPTDHPQAPAADGTVVPTEPARGSLWWEHEPQLMNRYRRGRR